MAKEVEERISKQTKIDVANFNLNKEIELNFELDDDELSYMVAERKIIIFTPGEYYGSSVHMINDVIAKQVYDEIIKRGGKPYKRRIENEPI